MKNINIFDLLEKKILSVEEKQQLDKLLSEDPEMNRIAEVYKSVKNITEKGSHLDSSILGEYTLIKNGLENENKWFLKLVPKIESHLRKCELCRNNFAMMNEEYSITENFVSESLNDKEQNINLPEKTHPGWWHLHKQSILKKTVYSVAALFLIYFSLFNFYNLTTPGYKKNFMVFEDNQKFNTRGRVSSEYQKGIAELDKRNFNEAIENLNSDIKSNPNDKTIFYTYFILGKIHLEASKKNVLGLFYSYDKSELEKSIDAFKKMIEKNNSAEFNHLNYDAYYFIARTLLLLNKNDEAKKYLKIVIDNKGGFKIDAENILKDL